MRRPSIPHSRPFAWGFVGSASLPPAFERPPSPPPAFSSPLFAWEATVEFLDAHSLGRLAPTCKELCALAGRSPAWSWIAAANEPHLFAVPENAMRAAPPAFAVRSPLATKRRCEEQALRHRAWLDGLALVHDYCRLRLAVGTAQRLHLQHYPLHALFASVTLAMLRTLGINPDLPWLAVVVTLVVLPFVVGASIALQHWSRAKQRSLLAQSRHIAIALNGSATHNKWMRVVQRMNAFPIVARSVLGVTANDNWHFDGFSWQVLALCSFGYQPQVALLVACALLWVVSFALLPYTFATFDVSAPRLVVSSAIAWFAHFFGAAPLAGLSDDDGLPTALISRLLVQICRLLAPSFSLPWAHPIAITQMTAAALCTGFCHYVLQRNRLPVGTVLTDVVLTALIPYGIHVIWSRLALFLAVEVSSAATVLFGIDALGAWVCDVLLTAVFTPALWPYLALWMVVLPVLAASKVAGPALSDKFKVGGIVMLAGVAQLSAAATASLSQPHAVGTRATILLCVPLVGGLYSRLRFFIVWLASEYEYSTARNSRRLAALCLAAEGVTLLWESYAFMFPVSTLQRLRSSPAVDVSVLLVVVCPVWAMVALSSFRRVRAAATSPSQTARADGCIVVLGGFGWPSELDEPLEES